MKFWIRYGSINGKGEWEETEAKDLAHAEEEAWMLACEDFESYEGLYGTRDVSMIMEEDGIEEDEAVSVYEEERGSYLDYEVRDEQPSEDD